MAGSSSSRCFFFVFFSPETLAKILYRVKQCGRTDIAALEPREKLTHFLLPAEHASPLTTNTVADASTGNPSAGVTRAALELGGWPGRPGATEHHQL